MKRALSPWLYLYSAAVAAFLLGPLIVVVVVSFGQDAYIVFPPRGFTLHWFVAAFTNLAFVNALLFSIELGASATIISAALGIPAALAISRGGKMSNAIEVALLSPLSLPMIVLGVGLLFFYGALGLGLAPIGLLLAHVVIIEPYVTRSVLAVHRASDPAFEEAAATLGASPITTFRQVTWPLIRPGVITGGLFAFLTSFDNVAVSIFLTRQDTTTIPVAILNYIVYSFDPSIAALYTVEMAVVILLLFLLERRVGLSAIAAQQPV